MTDPEPADERPWWKKKRFILPIAAVVVIAIATSGGDDDSDPAADDGDTASPVEPDEPDDVLPTNARRVSAADYGDRWPLTVDGGVLRCEPPSRVIFDSPDGTAYAVNGMAESHGAATIDPIWAEGNDTPRKNIGVLIDDGLALCD